MKKIYRVTVESTVYNVYEVGAASAEEARETYLEGHYVDGGQDDEGVTVAEAEETEEEEA